MNPEADDLAEMTLETTMPDADDVLRRQALSDLTDGACGTRAAAFACAAWRDDARARADWHAYQLIGDVLRSEDLAAPASHDEAFLVALRGRLAAEPVVLAPVRPPSQPAAARRRRGWMAPATVAAGFMAVAGVLVVTRVGAPVRSDGAPMLAALPQPAVSARNVLPVSSDTWVAVDGPQARDMRIERYLAAHKQYGTNTALAVPGVLLRNASPAAAPER